MYFPGTFAITPVINCAPQQHVSNAENNTDLYNGLIDSWSIQNFSPGKESREEHFFNTFAKFGLLVSKHPGDVLTEVVDRAGRQNLSYLELMLTPYDLGLVDANGEMTAALGKKVGWDDNLIALRDKLIAQGLKNIITPIPEKITYMENVLKNKLQCDQKNAQPGCKVKIRYQYLVLRGLPKAEVFAQMVAAFEVAKLDKRIVGVNLVQAEDGPIAVRDYKLHMQMLNTLHKIYPDVFITLHAGELAPTAVPPKALRFHIRDAIKIGQAKRIGHGVDIMYEDESEALLREIAEKQILVEINLSSNDSLLGVSGKQHPFPTYLNHKVPVALSTDDEGVLRTTITHEYQRAVRDYQLNYSTLKMLARNSLSYSFLPGKNLWQATNSEQIVKSCANDKLGNSNVSTNCQAILLGSEKVQLQWQLEKQFSEFEAKVLKMVNLKNGNPE